MSKPKALNRKKVEGFFSTSIQKGGDHMARTKTVEELQAEQERIEKELKIKTQKLKALQQQQKEQLRKERTHRLCTHGAILEQYLPPEEYSDKQIDEFFRTMFQIPEVVSILQWIKEQPDEQPETG